MKHHVRNLQICS